MTLNKLILPFLFIFTIIFLIANRVTNINCQIEGLSCPEDLLQNLADLKGSSFFFTNFEKKLTNNQNRDTVYILTSVKKEFPSTINLNFTQEKIEYELIVENESKYIGISGKNLPHKNNDIKLSIIWQKEDNIFEKNKVNSKYHNIFINVSKNLEKVTVDKIILNLISDSEIIMEIQGQPTYIFDIETIETQTKKVDTIIKARELEEIEEPILEIDMRFDLPVLRTRQ